MKKNNSKHYLIKYIEKGNYYYMSIHANNESDAIIQFYARKEKAKLIDLVLVKE